jgi:hypothetical protein
MSQGLNCVILSGDVGDVIYSETFVKNDPAVAFMLCVEAKENFPVWTKCNAYGDIARYIKLKNLSKGARVEIIGELINRKKRHEDRVELEVKVTRKINIFNKQPHGGSYGREEEQD